MEDHFDFEKIKNDALEMKRLDEKFKKSLFIAIVHNELMGIGKLKEHPMCKTPMILKMAIDAMVMDFPAWLVDHTMDAIINGEEPDNRHQYTLLSEFCYGLYCSYQTDNFDKDPEDAVREAKWLITCFMTYGPRIAPEFTRYDLEIVDLDSLLQGTKITRS